MMKPLKILLGNNTLSLLAGSETWTYTLAVQLKKMGHVVHCFSPQLGIISTNLEKEGILSFDRIAPPDGIPQFSIALEETVDRNYDVIIANHNHIVDFLRSQFRKTPIISTIHGIIHSDGEGNIAPEHPALNSGVNQFVSVSEEIQQKLKSDYSIDSVIVRNFFDLKKLKVRRAASKAKPKMFLINTNYAGRDNEEVQIIRDVSKHYGAKLAAVGMNFTQTEDITTALSDADVVIGMGRSVLEGVAAGRLGIVHGRWGTGGIISEGSIEELRQCNFSGRNSGGVLWTKEKMIAEIDKLYTPMNLKWGVGYIAREHNVVLAAEVYVKMARELLGLNIIRPSAMRPYRRQKDVA